MKIWDDYDDCIIGVGTRSGMLDVFIYDKHRMITKLVKRDDMSYDEAKEFIDFNIEGAYIGEDTPILVNLLTREEIKDYMEMYDDEETEIYELMDEFKAEQPFQHHSLKGKTLQVITKITTVDLSNESLEGVWHVEGMSHENIVVTAVCVLDQAKDIETNLQFRRRFTLTLSSPSAPH